MTTLTTTAAAATASSQAQGSTSAKASASLATGFDGFLKLLSAQLQHQDPLSPMDATQFTNQLVQFSSVEQAIESNKQLGQLTTLIRHDALASAAGLIGRDVAYDSDRVSLPAQGGAEVGYELPAAADKVTVTVRDAKGVVVRQAEAPAAAGAHSFVWDGLRDDGRRADPGVYAVAIDAVGKGGGPIQVTRSATGRVDAVETGSDGLVLTIGGVPVPLDKVGAIRGHAAAAAGNTAA